MDKNSKLRPLYIAKILYELTDEDHCLSTPEIISILESEYGITGYRTTIAADIELLTEFGMDIEVIKSSSNMYKNVDIIPYDDGTFGVKVNLAANHVFFSWIFGFGGKASIKAPEGVRNDYREMVKKEYTKLFEKHSDG